MVINWLREPLLHFLLIGAALFLAYSLQNDPDIGDITADRYRIVISGAQIDRLVAIWEKRWQRPPTRSELEGLIEREIREEVLSREALFMGLDNNDNVIRRRLAQKMEFIFTDIVAQVEPADAQLADYLNTNPEKFEIPGLISFVHIYFNTDKRGKQAQIDAELLLARLSQPDEDIDIDLAGDAFMLGQQHKALTETVVARLLGVDFAKVLFDLPAADSWKGPVSSSFGLHLVRIESKTPSRQPDLEAVRDRVLFEWEARQRRQMNESLYQTLRQRYGVVIENQASGEL